MRIVWLAGLILILFMGVPSGGANTEEQEEEVALVKLAISIHRSVERSAYAEARGQLADLAHRFIHSTRLGKKLHLRGIHLLSSLLLDLEVELNRAAIDTRRVQVAAHRLLLACDALKASHQPLWQHNYNALRTPALRWWHRVDSAPPNEESGVQGAWLQLQEMYQIVRPALLLAHSEAIVEELDSLLAYLQHPHTQTETKDALRRWLLVLENSFFPSTKHAMMIMGQREYETTVAMRMAAWLGISIGTVLVYVAMRRYLSTRSSKSIGQ